MRQQTSAILLAAASILEGFELARTSVGKYYKQLPAFTSLTALWQDASNRQLVEKHLPPARDTSVAHFDADNVRAQLAALQFVDECVFAEGEGEEAMNVHYKLADAAAALTLIGPCGSVAEMEDRMTDVVRRTASLCGQFLASAEALPAEALSNYGFVLKPRSQEGAA